MRYHDITKDDMKNGDGLRVVLWVAGCDHGCEGCHNPVTWDPTGGLEFDDAAKKELFAQLDQPYISGVTISGGDPLFMGNRLDIRELVQEIKDYAPDKTIWLYTGYLYEEIHMEPVLEWIDVLVDGPFILEQRDTTLHWKGSYNQRVIDMKKTRQEGRVCLWDDADGRKNEDNQN